MQCTALHTAARQTHCEFLTDWKMKDFSLEQKDNLRGGGGGRDPDGRTSNWECAWGCNSKWSDENTSIGDRSSFRRSLIHKSYKIIAASHN